MDNYLIRSATKNDSPFLADVVIAAEKGVSEILNYSTLFNLTESKVKELFIQMFDEEIDGCEFSISSFLIVEYNNKPVAAMGAWIEEFNGNLPSSILKANLISFYFPVDSLQYLKSKINLINDLQIEREKLALQLEYSYVSFDHRGKGLYSALTHKLIENAFLVYPELKKVQFQVYKNTMQVINFFEKQNYKIVKNYKSDYVDIFKYLPCNEKLLMEKEF